MKKTEKIVDANKTTTPIVNKEDVQKSKDNKIDQDFPGYPHHPSKEETIKKQKKNS